MFDRELLIKIMEEKNISAYKLAKESHVAQSTLSTILTGSNKNPSINTLSKLANALGVPVDNLFHKETGTSSINCEVKFEKEDKDIVLIERARNKMKPEEKNRMMKILRASFDIFDELDKEDKNGDGNGNDNNRH